MKTIQNTYVRMMKGFILLAVFVVCGIDLATASLQPKGISLHQVPDGWYYNERSYREAPPVKIPTSRDIFNEGYSELECLTLNIYFEARNQSLLGQELVAQVTVNRVRINGWRSTVCAVVRQHRQFEWTQDGKSDAPTNVAAYINAYLVGVAYLYEGRVANYPYAEQLTNYHALSRMPEDWRPWVEFIGRVEDHAFYRPSAVLRKRFGLV